MRARYPPKVEKNTGYPYKDLSGIIGGVYAKLLNPWAIDLLKHANAMSQQKNGITSKELCKGKKRGYGTPPEKAC